MPKKEPVQRAEWRQPTPLMQYTAIRSAIEGHVSNLGDHTADSGRAFIRTVGALAILCDHLRDLEPFLAGEGTWVDRNKS